MLNWVTKLLGGRATELPAGVPRPWVQGLEQLLGPLDALEPGKGRPGLAQDMLGFVLHGEPLAVLQEVAHLPEVAQTLKLTGYHYSHGESTLPDVYGHLSRVPPAMALRWARLLQACVQAQTSALRIQMTQDTHWPEVLLMASAGISITGWSSQRPRARGLDCRLLETLLQEDGRPPESLLQACLATPVDGRYGAEQRLLMLTDLPDYAQALARHVDAIAPLLLPPAVAQRLHVLVMLDKAEPATLNRLASLLAELGCAGSKQVRGRAEGLLRRCAGAAFAPLRAMAVQGKPEQRLHALRLLHRLGQQEKAQAEINFASDTAAADKAPSVQALITEWTTEAQPAESQAQLETVVLVQRPVIDWSAPACQIPAEALKRFWQEANEEVARANAHTRDHHTFLLAQGHTSELKLKRLFTPDDEAALLAYLATGAPQLAAREGLKSPNQSDVRPALLKLAEVDGLQPQALMKVLCFSSCTAQRDGELPRVVIEAFAAMHRRQGRPTLLELSVMLDDAGLPGRNLLRHYCYAWGTPFASDWPKEHVWPFVAEHLDLVLQALLQNTIKDYSFSREGLFRALATLPQPPAVAIQALFTLALGSAKTDRLPAQEVLCNLPGKEDRIIAALSEGKAETRAVAAQWLARLGYEPAVPALEKAVAKEKNDLAKGALLDALQALGQPIENYLDRRLMATEAAKSLAKGLPKELDYFPWSALPELRWADDGSAVPQELLRWLIVQAVKQKSPEPNAVLRKYCEMLDARDREAFGQFVLETWLREDVRPISPEEAMHRAQQHAQSMHAMMTAYPQYHQGSPLLGKSVEELTSAYLPALIRQPAGSAIASKGLLAIAAACARERAAAPTQRYLKEWYGSRAAQGKALIAMLAWIDHPSATQLMLAIGSRFRTKSFQEEATRQAEALAERKGWTLAELADRTVPSAGFDEAGLLELSYGSRVFTARLLSDLHVELLNPEGKKIAALPEPRQDDDAERAKEAKKAFSAAKKEVKSIVTLQTDRFYEALCTQREWPAADWKVYLQQHPVLRHLVQRLVWVEFVDGEPARAFRPLDDGTLIDHEDNAIELAPDAQVRLAHDSLLDAGDVAAWQQHLVDYEIQPLFQQLGKSRYALPQEKASAHEIKDFEGHMLESFALRGRATKLGYTRGAAEDGGWFHVYEKRFTTLGLQAVIEFTGSPLPEENRPVALLGLSFCSTADAWQRSMVALGKVPAVLLSECYNDLRLIAADGTGFDAEWRKKSEY